MDVNTSFLHEELDEEIFMDHPEGSAYENPYKVYKLKCSIAGVKQSSRRWYLKFH